MTAIAAISFRKRVYISGDSWVGNDYSQQLTPIPKVFKFGKLGVGLSGSQRVMQQIRIVLQEAQDSGIDFTEDWVMNIFPDVLIKKLEAAKALGETEDDKVANMDAGAVIGLDGNIYVLESNFGVHKRVWYAADGMGFTWIMGALEALAMKKACMQGKTIGTVGRPDSAAECKEWLTLALKAAEAGCPGVKGPFHLVVV